MTGKQAGVLRSFIIFLILFNGASWAERSEHIIKTTVEYTTPSRGFTLAEPYTSIMHANNSTYFVWVDSTFRPWISQTTNGNTITVPIDANPDYLAQADGHHRFSLGVDSDGYIHVTGDMHHYSTFTTSAATPYPVRYQRQSMMYWKSNQPGNVSGGFTFAGGVNSKTTMPGGGWMMGRFFTDNDGVLYYSSHVHAFEASNNNWQMAVGLYRYDVSTKTWTAIGKTLPTNTQPNMINIFPVLFWEKNGLGGGWFQNYQAQFKFDSSNRLHFSVTVNTDGGAGLNSVVYAVSDDAGLTWKRANGNVISGGLPLRGLDGLASSADIVKELNESPYLSPSVGLAVDKNGKPGVSINNEWIVWDGSKWATSTPLNTRLPRAGYGYRLPTNDLLLNAAQTSKLIRTSSFDKNGIAYDYTSPIMNVDEHSLIRTGFIYGATDNKLTKTHSVTRTEIIPASLPKGWKSKNISLNPESYNGESGYMDGQFVVRSYGTELEGINDSFAFVFKHIKNDGVISARVDLPESYSTAGLMMRESLASNAKYVGIFLNPTPQGKNVQYKQRALTNARGVGYGLPIAASPCWLKIVRKGDMFTTYYSLDDINWSKMESKSIPMAKDIYIGLAVVSNGHKWYSETATFDNLVASVNTKYLH